jgi:hypothetical protein
MALFFNGADRKMDEQPVGMEFRRRTQAEIEQILTGVCG